MSPDIEAPLPVPSSKILSGGRLFLHSPSAYWHRVAKGQEDALSRLVSASKENPPLLKSGSLNSKRHKRTGLFAAQWEGNLIVPFKYNDTRKNFIGLILQNLKWKKWKKLFGGSLFITIDAYMKNLLHEPESLSACDLQANVWSRFIKTGCLNYNFWSIWEMLYYWLFYFHKLKRITKNAP